MRKQSTVSRLRDAGFDESTARHFGGGWRVRCSCCEALVINGIPTHERGCPNVPRDTDDCDDYDC